jgi:OTU domain-containing protein 3
MVGVLILKYDMQMVFRSYHDEEHYNSVRLKEDPSDGPARPIIIKVYV